VAFAETGKSATTRTFETQVGEELLSLKTLHDRSGARFKALMIDGSDKNWQTSKPIWRNRLIAIQV
jgi:hypothetical protein